jgi:hypothetical protein
LQVFIGILKFIAFLLTFLLVKFGSVYCLNLPVFAVSVFLEAILVFIVTGVFVLVFDSSKRTFAEKLITALELSGCFIAVFFIFAIIKNAVNKTLFSALVNFMLTGLMGSLPFIRDKFLFDNTPKRYIKFDLILIAYFVGMKLQLNVLHLWLTSSFSADIDVLPYWLIAGFVCGIYVTKSIVFSISLSGYIEYDGREYPVFDSFRVGKSKLSDICIDEKGGKSTIFYVSVNAKGWAVRSNADITLEGDPVNKSAIVESGDTIEYDNNYFTVTASKGNIFKRLFIFFFLIISVFCLNAQSGGDTFNSNDIITVTNVNYSCYPTINIYFNDTEIHKKLASKYTFSKRDFFILEDGNNPTDFRDISDSDRPADIVLVMDITGTLQDSYTKMRSTIENAMQSVASVRSPLRVGLITFADTPDESIFRDLTEDYSYIIDSLIKAAPQSGGDYEENPYDALMRVRDFSFRDEAQKIVILVTDAPPHVKGDKGNKGRDFTNYSTEDVDKFFAGSPYMLYVVTYSRFAEYHRLIKDDADLFDISSFESPNVIIRDLTNVINNQIKMTYTAKRSKSFYTRNNNGVRDKITVYKDLDAHKAKNFYNQKKIKKNSFMNSLFDGF